MKAKLRNALLLSVGLTLTITCHASLQFNGSDSKAVLDGSYLDGTTHSNYTFELWIKPFSLSTGNDIYLLGKNEYWKAWWLSITPQNGLYLGGSWPSYYWGSGVGTNSLRSNVWQHVCCAVTNGQASFYVNANLIGTEAVQNPIDFLAVYPDSAAPQLDAAMSIGYGDSGTTPDYAFFNGLIYGIKVWSRALSASEVNSIFMLGIPPSTNGLYNAVMLDEVSGTTIEDSRTGLTGRNLAAVQSSDTPPMSQADLSFTNSTPIASYYIDLSHSNDFKTPVLSSQSNYCFRATGRGGVGPLDRGDTMADAAFYPSFHPLTAKWAAPANSWTWVDHPQFRPTPDVFNPAHVYYFYFQGNNTFEELAFQDNPYSDNVGGFTVDLFAVSGPCVPHPAVATLQVVNGFVVGATITDGGCGYTNTPVVLIQGGGGTGATASAVVSNGVVVNIVITGAGSGYTGSPSLYIYPPGVQPGPSITTNFIQTVNFFLSGFKQAGGSNSTSVSPVHIGTKDILRDLEAATGTNFSPRAQITAVTPMGGGPTAFIVQDPSNSTQTDVSSWLSTTIVGTPVARAKANARGNIIGTAYSIESFSYGATDTNGASTAITLKDVQGFTTTQLGNGAFNANVHGTGTMNGNPIVIKGIITGRAGKLEEVSQ